MKISLRNFGALAALALLLVTCNAYAANPFADTYSQMSTVSQNVANQLVPYAFKLLGTLFLIQFTLRNYKTVLSGQADLLQVLGKLAFSIIWIGFLMYLIQNNFMILNAIFTSFQKLSGIAAGGVKMSPDLIMQKGIWLQNQMGAAYNTATGANDGFVNAMKYFFPSMLMCVACLTIMVSFFIIALAVAIAELEFYLILAAAPIAYAMGGLDALKQSSIAPLQTMLSIGYRILILGVIVGVIHGQVNGWVASFSTVTVNDWTPIWTVVFGCLLGAVAAFSAGKIAGALASGQSNISGNEAMFAGLQMMQTIATTMTGAGAAAQLASSAAGMATDGAAGAAGMASKGYATLADVFGGTGSIANVGDGTSATSPVQAAQSLLGPISGASTGGAADTTSAGNAMDAGIGGGSSWGGAGGSGASSGGNDVARALQEMQGRQPSAGSQLGRTAISHLQGMQHDSGNVQVHVDPHSKD